MKKIIYILLISVFHFGCDKQTPEPIESIILQDDLNYICFLNETININFLENDSIAGEATIIVDEPSNGTLKIQSDGLTYLYTPNSGFIGTDVFYYEACNSNDCQMAKIKIDVAPTLDACDEIFEAKEDYISIDINSKYSFSIQDLLRNDLSCTEDKSIDLFSLMKQPIHGKIEVLNGGFLVYTPNVDFKGVDVFEYQIVAETNIYVKSKTKVQFAVGVKHIVL